MKVRIRSAEAALDGPASARADDLDAISDTRLLQGCRTGDAESWDALVHRYERLVFSVALRSGLSPTDAADVTQSTFIALLEACDRLNDDERLAAWLITVARRKAWRVIRRTSREWLSDEIPTEPAPGLSWEEIAVLHDALLRLAAPCRELLIALYFDPEKPSYAEIAARFDRSVGGIGPMRGRCLQRMRGLLDEEAP